ncbi:MAG: hypothetical protein R3A49_12060 [Acidimicrobiia bacterium]
MSTAFRKGAGVGIGIGLVLVAALALALTFAPAGSAQESDEGSGDDSPDATQPDDGPSRQPLSDEERACLEENGAQLPELDEDGNPIRPERPDPSERPEPGSEEFEQKRTEMRERHEAFRAAAEACGIELPERGPRGPGCRHPLPGDEAPGGTDDDAPAEGTSIGDAFLAA